MVVYSCIGGHLNVPVPDSTTMCTYSSCHNTTMVGVAAVVDGPMCCSLTRTCSRHHNVVGGFCIVLAIGQQCRKLDEGLDTWGPICCGQCRWWLLGIASCNGWIVVVVPCHGRLLRRGGGWLHGDDHCCWLHRLGMWPWGGAAALRLALTRATAAVEVQRRTAP